MSETLSEWQKNAQHTLDATGLLCPEPVMMLHNVVRDAATGDTILVIATDPSTERDIPRFCQYLGHALEQQAQVEDKYLYLLRKG